LESGHTALPKLPKLKTVLASIIAENRSSTEQLRITRRERLNLGTSPKEIVTCELADGRIIRLFCKYAAEQNHTAYGHRRGVVHEVGVYSKLLQSMPVSTPSLQGFYTDGAAGEIWLILEYLDGGVCVTTATEPDAMVLAARWIGQFHAAAAAHLASEAITFLKPYDAAYYHGWARRTLKYAACFLEHFQWLEPLLEQFDKVVASLLAAPLTVIHGEYYSQNILFRDGKIFPVDWESAAVAAGEIDLASLVEGWPEETARTYELAYQRERWPDGRPRDLERTLCAARIYLCLRWLGERSEWTTADSWRFDRLHSAGRQFGLI